VKRPETPTLTPPIEGHCKNLDITPTEHRDPFYTLPAIHDPSTGTYLADSLKIAQYLENTYPSTPSLFPDNTLGLQAAFMYAFHKQLDTMWQFTYAPECHILNERSAEYFRRKTEKKFGRSLEDLVLKGKGGEIEWGRFKAGLGRVDSWYAKSSGPFILDASPSWADFVVASYAMWWRSIWGEDSKEWDDIVSWHGGRWAKLLANLKDYQEVI
jgi:glutathione S-transferase